MNELRYAFRQWARQPGLAVIVVLMLALGVGATTAVFSSFHAILVRPLLVPNPEQLVNLGVPGPRLGSTTAGDAGSQPYVFSYPMFRDLEAQQTSFTGISAHVSFPANLSRDSRAEAGTGMLVSGSYFGVLGLRPALGRLIGVEDEPGVGESAVVVLSYRYWVNNFGSDPEAVGKTLRVNSQSLTIIGVAPEGFSGTTIGVRPQVFVPLTMRWLLLPTARADEERRFSRWLYLFARLKPTVSIEQARAAMNVLHSAIVNEVEAPLLAAVPAALKDPFLARQMTLEPGARGQSVIPNAAGLPLKLLLGLTAIVMLIVCVNVANLMLARGVTRAGEMGIRTSLGASKRRLVSQVLAEGGLLALVGGLLSVPVASLVLGAIVAISPEQVATDLAIEPNWTTLSFVAGLSTATLLAFSLSPALQAGRADPGHALKAHGLQSVGGRRVGRIRGALAAVQVAFSMVLLVLAGLFAQSLRNVAEVDLGMDVDQVVAFDVSPRLAGYGPEETMGLIDGIEAAIGAQPGVVSVASSWVRLLINDFSRGSVVIEGTENAPGFDATTYFNAVSPGFLETLSINLLAGRDFSAADSSDSPRVAIVNQTFAEKFALRGDIVGVRFEGVYDQSYEIVGLVEDAKYTDVKGDIPPQYFIPQRQYRNRETLTFYARSAIGPDALMATIPRAVAAVDSDLPVDNLMPLRKVAQDNVYLDRVITVLSVGFAGMAVVLAAIGLYGVVSYNVSCRTREFGLRQALGATPACVRSLVFKQVGLLALVGVPLGLVAAAALGRAAESLLFGLSASEPTVFLSAMILLSIVASGAGWIPARRAAQIQPMRALREE